MTAHTPEPNNPNDQALLAELDRLGADDRETPAGYEDRVLEAVLHASSDASAMPDVLAREPRAHRRLRFPSAISIGALSGLAAAIAVAVIIVPPSEDPTTPIALNDADEAWLLAEVMDALDDPAESFASFDALSTELDALDPDADDGVEDVLDLYSADSAGGLL